MAARLLLVCFCVRTSAYTVPLAASRPVDALQVCSLLRVGDGQLLDLGKALESPDSRTLIVLGTYPADFNMIEYAQKLRHFAPALKQKGVGRMIVVVNGLPASCVKLASLLDLPSELELFSDPSGEAGRRFGANRGWRQDDTWLSPYLKLYIMLFGIGPPATLPAVLGGYVGNPSGSRAWIETALQQGQSAGRWPSNVLKPSEAEGKLQNQFDALPLVGAWGLRPLELATLRLQNLIGVSFNHWSALRPSDERTLTQLGGCTVVGPEGRTIYSWLDDGICDTANFDELLAAL